MLLIATNQGDLASDFLVLRLQERRVPYFRFNTETMGRRFSAEIVVDSGHVGFTVHRSDGTALTSSEVTGAYLRDPRLPLLAKSGVAAEDDWIAEETREFLRALWRLIPYKSWLNHPVAIHRASNKVEQLQVATKLGFRVPKTWSSSGKEGFEEFVDAQGGEAIVKAVRAGFLLTSSNLYFAPTRRVSRGDVADFRNSIHVPMICQELVQKRADIRVCVVGESLFATEILSQQHAETAVDWRTWDFSGVALEHRPLTLPPSVEEFCMAITVEFGLRYAAIDLVVDRSGDFVFLELNPTGQWAWIEQMVGYPIRDAIIDELCR